MVSGNVLLTIMAKIQEFLFTTVKAEAFGDDNAISVTCKTCKDSKTFEGSYEAIFDNRRKWIEDHSCNAFTALPKMPEFIIGSEVTNGHN